MFAVGKFLFVSAFTLVFLIPAALVLAVIGLPIAAVLGVLALPVLIVLFIVGLPVFLVLLVVGAFVGAIWCPRGVCRVDGWRRSSWCCSRCCRWRSSRGC